MGAQTTLARRDPDGWLQAAVVRLQEWGLMLASDQALPSLPSLVVERHVAGSWWADPEANLIYQSARRLAGHPDVVYVVLVSAKLTYLHKRLAPALLAVALNDADWKFAGLPPPARAIWERLKQEPLLYADEPGLPAADVRQNGRLMRDLEARLLCAGGNVHTLRGSHAKFAIRWDAWMSGRKLAKPRISAETGTKRLDECLDRLNLEFGGHGKMPWWRAARGRSRRGLIGGNR
jgi:hypothetical protein